MTRARRVALLLLSALSISALLVGSAFGLDHRLARWVTTPLKPAVHETPRRVRTPSAPAIRVEPPHRDVLGALDVAGTLNLGDLRAAHEGSGSGAAHVARPPAVQVVTLDPNAVTMPDVIGMRVGAARRQLRALGLRVRALDDDGYAISPDLGPYYRIEWSSVAAGTQVPRGTTIRLHASNPDELAEGY